MKFTKFGKALLMSALSAGVILSVTSCVQDYSVGYLFVTGTDTAGTGQPVGSGIISGFKIDHNTGKLTPINGLPIASGGANPVRAVLLTGSRFLYVLNRGVNSSGGSDCTSADPCTGANITQFALGANGILTPQETYYTQGVNPFRLIADSSHLYVLEHDSPDNANPSATDGCAKALAGAQTCGDITAFSINTTTGRLQLIVNSQVSAASGGALPYYPVPANPVDFSLSSSYILTLTSATAQTSYPYTGGSTIFPYAYSSSTGQLGSTGMAAPYDALNIAAGTALANGGGYVYVLDNEAPNPNPTGALSQILPYTVGANGSLVAATTGPIADDPTQSNPTALAIESKGKWFYVANQGNDVTGTGTPESGIAGYNINNPYQPREMSGLPIGFGTGSGPQCLVEDPTNQFFYTANLNSSSVTGQVIDENVGTLTPLSQASKVPSSYTLNGPPTWCLVDGRTS